ncbi:translation initiation factor IF-2 [Delphinus delphis]|uniref:translation initiation factor IF-2 n=1 Tax=Delphinus delphis TaxID=9728 RepID=UPI00375010EF
MGTLRRMLIHVGEEPWAASVRQAGDQLVVCPKKGGALANGRNRSTTGVTSRWLFSKKVSGTGRASRHPIGQNRPLQAALIGGSGLGAGAPAAEPSGSGARPGLLPARAARAARAAEGRAPRGLSGAVPAGGRTFRGSAGSPGAAAPGRRLSALLVLLGGAAHPAPRPVSCQGAAGCAGHKERAGGRCGTTAPRSRARPPTGPDPTAPRPRARPGAHRPRPRGREKFAARPRGPDQRGLWGASSAGARCATIAPSRLRTGLGSRVCLGLSARGQITKRRAGTLRCARSHPSAPREGTCQPHVFRRPYVKVALSEKSITHHFYLKRLTIGQLGGTTRSCRARLGTEPGSR